MKKRLLAWLLTLVLLLALLPTAVFAEDTAMSGTCGAEGNKNNVRWALTPNGTTVTVSGEEKPAYLLTISGTGAMADFTWISADSATNAGWGKFRRQITDVVVENGITYIGELSFRSFSNLETLTLPDSVESIGHDAVYYSSRTSAAGLTLTRIPASLREIGEAAFGNTFLRGKISLPETTTSIGRSAFVATKINSVQIRAKNVSIGAYAFGSSSSTLVALDLSAVSSVEVGDLITQSDKQTILYVDRLCLEKVAGLTPDHLMAIGVTNGGTFPTATQFIAGQLATPVKDGYKFEGWYTDADCTVKLEVAPEKGKTYYASWSESADEIVGKEDGARMTVDLGSIVEGQTVTFKGTKKLDYVLADYGYFTYEKSEDGMSITIAPLSSLTAGTYRDTLYVYTADKAVHFIDVTLTVTPIPTPDPTPEPTPVIPVTPSAPAKNPFNLDAGKAKFTDVSDNAWYASAVNYAVDKGLMNGIGDNKFSPEADTTRGMIVTILARLDGKNTSGNPWYQAGQRWAMEYEISDGTNMTSAITREQLVTMLFRYAVKNGLDAVTLAENLSRFTDASDVSAWAVPAMQWAVGQGLIQGSNGQLRPQANASRAEVATILMRFCELLNK